MIAIYICEDHEEELAFVTETIQNHMLFHHDHAAHIIYTFRDPHDLLQTLRAQDPSLPLEANLYFLDIDFGCRDINGIRLAQEIRRTDPVGFLIFITTHDKYLPITFEYLLDATNFITKGQQPLQNQITRTLDLIVRKIRYNSSANAFFQRKIRLKSGRTILQIPEQSILFFRISGKHQVSVATKWTVEQVSDTLKEIMKQLEPKAFVLSSRDVIVNLRYVQKLLTNSILVEYGHELPMSARRKADVTARLIEFRKAQT